MSLDQKLYLVAFQITFTRDPTKLLKEKRHNGHETPQFEDTPFLQPHNPRIDSPRLLLCSFWLVLREGSSLLGFLM